MKNNDDNEAELGGSVYSKYQDIWNWFCNDVNFANEHDNKTYFELFIENGCESLNDIALIQGEQDLIHVGIENVNHRLKIWSAIRRLRLPETKMSPIHPHKICSASNDDTMNNDFMNKFMKEFEEQLKKEAQDSLKQYVEKYKKELDNVETTNDELMKKAINDYHDQRKDHAIQMGKMIEDKLAKSKQDFESKLAKIDDELLCTIHLGLLYIIHIYLHIS